jgi:hypothetical protein
VRPTNYSKFLTSDARSVWLDMANSIWRRRAARLRRILIAAVAAIGTLSSHPAGATITQGDFSVFATVETREAGRWGEGGSKDNAVKTIPNPNPKLSPFVIPGRSATESGGSFDFARWDLVEARQVLSLRPDYHFVKRHKAFGRFDTMFLEDADFFMYYRPWYDAEGSLKSRGRAEPYRDWDTYTQRELQAEYFRNDLHEYYAQLNFTDNFSMRIGKQQIIWSEASLLSGTEITNPGDATFHGFVGAESAEDLRKNLRMIKTDYLLPDFLATSNNEIEAFWIPGDFEGFGGLRSNVTLGLTDVSTDSRNPYVVPVSLSGAFTAGTTFGSALYNQEGQPVRVTSLLDLPQKPMISGNFGARSLSVFFDFATRDVSRAPSNSIANSEFGMRLSTLLPIGQGLQTSFIALYEDRNPRTGLCVECEAPHNYKRIEGAGGLFITKKPPPGALPPNFGTVLLLTSTEYRRNFYFGLTGTYYDKDLTESVFRYDALYAPKVGISAGPPKLAKHNTFSRWTELSRLVLSLDRPTIVPLLTPYLTKQHTLLSAGVTETFYPDLPAGSVPNDNQGKIRRLSTFLTFTATDFLANGQVVNLSGFSWDADDQTGQLIGNSVWRYSRSILLGVNVDWYLGRSGRHTDPFLESKSQRINELEFTFTYEL